MSNQYPGGIITKNPATPTGPYESGAAPGIWTITQQAGYKQQGVWPTAGLLPNYIEDVFSTYLYTGNGSTQTITNGIDLSTKVGMVWLKGRSLGYNNYLFDTVRGAGNSIYSNLQIAQQTSATTLTAFGSTGFSIGSESDINENATTYVSWTFREQPKFFDVVTYTGDGIAGRTVAHNLGVVPGCMIIKPFSTSGEWRVWHRGLAAPATSFLYLNRTDAEVTGSTIWNSTNPTATEFTVSGSASNNGLGTQYVAYLFAHDAGGFGLTGTDNVISCGSFTTDGSGNATVSLGYEPQFWLYKPNLAARYWTIYDTMRGWSQTQIANLNPNVSDAEGGGAATAFYPTATGFDCVGSNLDASTQHIYIAIRRGPMKVPTLGTDVFAPLARTGSGTNPTVVTTGNNPDLLMSFPRTANPAAYGTVFFDKLRGVSQFLQSANTNAEATTSGTFCLQRFLNTGFQTGADFAEGYLNYSGATYAQYAMTRAPGFFDEVCYTGDGTAGRAITHNLGVTPEWMIVKRRSNNDGAGFWASYSATTGNTQSTQFGTVAAALTNSTFWNNTSPTSTNFTVGTITRVNGSGETYVAYLFATCAGVSKVGSYTGTGATQTINCGFTGGARFVLIKRTDSTGDWYVWDSARGIIAGNDPYLLLNTTDAEVTGTDYIDTAATGFEITSTAPAAINANGGTYIFLAIA